MANLLCVWEMGSNLGHLSNLKPFIDEALSRGHSVSLAAVELDNIPILFPGYPLQIFLTPRLKIIKKQHAKPLCSFSQMITGYYVNSQRVRLLDSGWESIFKAVQPDVVVYDHAPTALLASYGNHWVKWVVGSGFLIPPTDEKYFGFFPGAEKVTNAEVYAGESDSALLALLNQHLMSKGLPTMPRIQDLYDQVDEKLFATIPELDHYKVRAGVDYLGLPPSLSGMKQDWPEKKGIKVFAYLSASPQCEKIFRVLVANNCAVLVYSRDMPEDVKQKFPAIRFVDQPLDIQELAKEADLAITGGNHQTASQFYLYGITQILIPRQQEQVFYAQRVVESGGGVILSPAEDSVDKVVMEAIRLAIHNRHKPFRMSSPEMNGAKLVERVRALYERLEQSLH